MIPLLMAEKVIISKTCKKVFNYHKLINAFNKLKKSMTLPIAETESHNLVPKNMISPIISKIKTMVLLISKHESQSLLHTHNPVIQE